MFIWERSLADWQGVIKNAVYLLKFYEGYENNTATGCRFYEYFVKAILLIIFIKQ